jgi:signal transduction histidine kinase
MFLPESQDAQDAEGLEGSRTHHFVGRLLVLTDITELTRMLQVKTDFVMNASHELRTPLSAIRAAVETLLGMDGAEHTHASRQIVHMIDRHSARLEAMVADLLDLSRIESGTARFQPETLHLEQTLSELRERFARRLNEKDLHWEMETHPPDATATVSPSLLNIVLDNLLDNAIKFTPDGGTVRTVAKVDNSTCHICVEDTGCGISEDEQSRVFERFYQVERARTGTTRGTGLGLSIVRHAVNAMSGSVDLDSAVGQGTRITITIPQPDH